MSCDWPIDRTCLPDLPVLPGSPTVDEQAAYDLALARRNVAEDIAVSVLWALSGRQFGVCESTVRPCPMPPRWPTDRSFYWSSYTLILDVGHWINYPCGCGPGGCEVAGPRVIHLPGPAVAVTEVSIGGSVLSPTVYALEGNALYRRGADWPRQDLGRPLGETGTWSVTYTRGISVPAGVDRLAGLLAKEFIAACDGSGKCRLPKTVVSTTSRGVTHSFDPKKILAAGYTGLPEVDMWLAAVNPAHLIAAPMVI